MTNRVGTRSTASDFLGTRASDALERTLANLRCDRPARRAVQLLLVRCPQDTPFFFINKNNINVGTIVKFSAPQLSEADDTSRGRLPSAGGVLVRWLAMPLN